MIIHNNIELIATCPEETKEISIKELKSLGCFNIKEGFKAIYFSVGSYEDFYRIHLQVRTISRIFLILKKCSAVSPEMLFNQARRINWQEYFDVGKTFMVEGVPADRDQSKMTANDISKKVRQAIEYVFEKKVKKTPKVDVKNKDVKIIAWINAGRCIISLDTSGKSLHKRGYRLDDHPAPLKETLAASMLKICGYSGDQAFLDPMCGSGTLVIEAAMIALNKAPLIHRKKGEFGFEHLKFFDNNIWKKVQTNVRKQQLNGPSNNLYASDINDNYINLTRSNALRARVQKHITSFICAPFEKRVKPEETGLLISNLPYNQRLTYKDKNKMIEFYKGIGDHLKRNYNGWVAAFLVAEDSPYKFIGLKPFKKIELLNGSIKVKLIIFDIYRGSKGKKI